MQTTNTRARAQGVRRALAAALTAVEAEYMRASNRAAAARAAAAGRQVAPALVALAEQNLDGIASVRGFVKALIHQAEDILERAR